MIYPGKEPIRAQTAPSKEALTGLPNGARLILAPLCGITTAVFRKICFDRGAEMAVTEMICAEAVSRGKLDHVRALKGLDAGEGPLSAQIFGADPEQMGRTAEWLSSFNPEYVDINFGCPVKKIVKKNGGSAVLRDLKLLGEICRAVVRCSKVPVSAKVRAGWSKPSETEIREISRTVEDAGVSMLTVHARTKNQGYAHKADWDLIAAARDAVNIPVVGNGDLKNAEDVISMGQRTGCDAVMIGRAAIGNPWVFAEMKARLDGKQYTPPSTRERLCTLVDHVRRSVEVNGEPLGVINTRKNTAAYLKSVPGARRLRSELMLVASFSELEDKLEEFMGQKDIRLD
jgi:tRNA-dihydrouridine synthase B